MKLNPEEAFKRVGIVAPAGPVRKEQIEEALRVFRNHHLEPVFAPHLFDNAGIVASSVENRLADLEGFYRDDAIDLIWAARGGYGTIQLLSDVPYPLIAQAQKPLIGFSDVTALQWAIYARTGMPSYSGFALTLQVTERNPYLQAGMEVIRGTRKHYSDIPGLEVIQPGEARGILLSGTLALITSLMGTPYFPNVSDIILCIEDVDEPLYRIDRMLHQLKLSGVVSRVRGVLLGQFLWKERSLDIVPIIKSIFPSNIPIVVNLPYGHVAQSLVMPTGIEIFLRAFPFEIRWENNII